MGTDVELRAEFGRAIQSLKSQIADDQRIETLDFTILDALVAGEQDTADPAWLTATPQPVDDINSDPSAPSTESGDPDAPNPES